jgi:type III secretion protein Q
MNALPVIEASLAEGSSLAEGTSPAQGGSLAERRSLAERLPRIPASAAALTTLYELGELLRTVDGVAWLFAWRHFDGLFKGVEITLQLGDARVAVGLADLSPFGSATDIVRLPLPPPLRAAYLSGIGASVWRELETLARCAVQIVSVQPDVTRHLAPQCIGFEISVSPNGPATRGFVHPLDESAQALLKEVSGRELPRPIARDDIPVSWAAILGSTRLPLADARALESHDIVIIDNANFTPDALGCSVAVGRARRPVARASLQMGRLHLIELTTAGAPFMTNPEDVIDDIPVTLRFEMAQWQAPLAQVSGLAPGSVIDLGKPIDSQVITVWVEQRCIGSGQLVAVGERLGVRLLNVFHGNAEHTPVDLHGEEAATGQGG